MTLPAGMWLKVATNNSGGYIVNHRFSAVIIVLQLLAQMHSLSTDRERLAHIIDIVSSNPLYRGSTMSICT